MPLFLIERFGFFKNTTQEYLTYLGDVRDPFSTDLIKYLQVLVPLN